MRSKSFKISAYRNETKSQQFLVIKFYRHERNVTNNRDIKKLNSRELVLTKLTEL